LNVRWQFADFIEEKRAFVGQFEQSRLGTVGSAESSFFIAKQFAFNEMLGQSRAVDINPGLAVTVGVFVNAAGDKFFAAAGFPGYEDGFRVPRNALHQEHEALHRATSHNEFCAVDFTPNRRACFQCIPQRWPA
jgi:hypothetical protein